MHELTSLSSVFLLPVPRSSSVSEAEGAPIAPLGSSWQQGKEAVFKEMRRGSNLETLEENILFPPGLPALSIQSCFVTFVGIY